MNTWKLIQRIGQILIAIFLVAIGIRLFMPLIERQREMRARAEALREDIQKSAEELRMLKLKQEKLQEDPRFIEQIAREKLRYAKPGETVFRFVDEENP
jgi:cell division protein FtsB